MDNDSAKSLSRESESLFRIANKIMPGGVNGNIKFRAPFPHFLRKAAGSHVFDVDGNEFIDYVLSYGTLILGHGHKAIRDAISETLRDEGTILFGNPSPKEIEMAGILLNLFMKDGKIRFTNSGTESTLLAVRLSMAVTDRTKVAKFDGHYHGANPFLLVNYKPKNHSLDQNGNIMKEPDSYEIRGNLLDDTVILPFNDEEGTRRALDNTDVAAVIVEAFEDGYIPADRGFMNFLRNYTKEHGIMLIFDEVKTGMRIRPGGATEYFGIKPDLICLGKIIGGGTPIGALVGRPEIMDLLDPRATERKVFHSGTFNGNPLTMEVGLATIRELLKDNNFQKIVDLSADLAGIFHSVLDEMGVEHRMYSEGGITNFTIGDKIIRTHSDISHDSAVVRKMIDEALLSSGIYSIPGSRFSLSLAHTQEDLEKTGDALRKSVSSVLETETFLKMKRG